MTKHRNRQRFSIAAIRQWPKLLLHEHLDCSLRPATLLELASCIGFANEAFTELPFPAEIVDDWNAAGTNKRKRAKVAAQYQKFIAGHASSSLANYVQAIVKHVLPVMQTEDALYRITKERIEDAVADGVIAMELRFAPQLHTWDGLSLRQVMNAVIRAVNESPIPVKLIVCALRHENGRMAYRLANLCIEYRKYVCKFDLAGDEAANPGVLKWWLKQALRLREHGIEPTIHLWETNEPTDEDIALLDKHAILVLGHGFRGDRQGKRVLTICVTSNIVTGQVECAADHPIDELFNEDKLVTVETDGTLFTLTSGTGEYVLLNRTFGWGRAHFLRCNKTSLKYSSFKGAERARLARRLEDGYRE
jgi:adenosine deaminase